MGKALPPQVIKAEDTPTIDHLSISVASFLLLSRGIFTVVSRKTIYRTVRISQATFPTALGLHSIVRICGSRPATRAATTETSADAHPTAAAAACSSSWVGCGTGGRLSGASPPGHAGAARYRRRARCGLS